MKVSWLSTGLPYATLLVWVVPLLLFSNGHQSLLVHDEGLYAGRARLMLESGDWINPWSSPHHKLPGIYWLIASAYSVMGISETTARLPSTIAALLSLWFLYEIGKILLNPRAAWLATAILGVEVLWVRYSRLAGPDAPMVCCLLAGIWFLLRAEQSPDQSIELSTEQSPASGQWWRFAAGISFGLSFLIRGFMVVLPIAAIMPYLIWQNPRHRHLSSPWLLLGTAVGLLPSAAWIGANWLRFGPEAVQALFSLLLDLGMHQRYGNNIFYYFWNLPLNSFPWALFALIGGRVLWKRPVPRYQWLLLGCPAILLTGVTLFSTRVPHYALPLYPFIALLAGVALDDWLNRLPKQSRAASKDSSLAKVLSIALFIWLALVGFLLRRVVLPDELGGTEVQAYGSIAAAVGVCGLLLSISPLQAAIWRPLGHWWRGSKKIKISWHWSINWLIACWVGLAAAGLTGVLGDFNPSMKQFVQQPAIASILNHYPIHFAQLEGKAAVLLKFYTPRWGEDLDAATQIPIGSYAWICSLPGADSQQYQVLGQINACQLIQVLTRDLSTDILEQQRASDSVSESINESNESISVR